MKIVAGFHPCTSVAREMTIPRKEKKTPRTTGAGGARRFRRRVAEGLLRAFEEGTIAGIEHDLHADFAVEGNTGL
jgi:hypothetical protein